MKHLATDWLRSSFCGGGGNNCVEVAAVGEGIALRESEDPGQVVAMDRAAFGALLAGVKAGRLARPGH
ncbi:DUF397 domain-containing protein [Streptomyces sp. ACA25]|uniref:DUF397 domain-containing protein n=1 Tax=Streptomyces sp. ACA25 TaxID=3022596 RepID=UPI0023072484|nr:DUF397 domain-containing protein [Streptomyces sp. ACA25]MDB1086592.1 DUF397 domain-containing protein [Streptomyces sp. ACA25]